MYALGLITARGGSKRLPGKNLTPLGGIPLIGWAIRAANQSKLLNRTLFDTDDPNIAQAARDLGADAPFLRPPELARDNTPHVPVLQYDVRWFESATHQKPDLIVLIQPTSPLRTAQDIDDCIRLVIDTGCDSAQTICVDTAHPYHRFTLEGNRMMPLYPDALARLKQGEKLPPAYKPTGAVYVVRYRVLMEENALAGKDHRGLVRDPEVSIDIDTLLDFKSAEWLLNQRQSSR